MVKGWSHPQIKDRIPRAISQRFQSSIWGLKENSWINAQISLIKGTRVIHWQRRGYQAHQWAQGYPEQRV